MFMDPSADGPPEPWHCPGSATACVAGEASAASRHPLAQGARCRGRRPRWLAPGAMARRWPLEPSPAEFTFSRKTRGCAAEDGGRVSSPGFC